MIDGTEVREGMLLLIDGKVYKVVSAVRAGAAKSHNMMHAGLKSIPDGRRKKRVMVKIIGE